MLQPDLGPSIGAFQFSVSAQRRYLFPFLAGVGVPFLVWMALLVLLQVFDVQGQRGPLLLIVMVLVGPVVLLTLGLPAWREPSTEIVTYERGFVVDGHTWLWEELASVMILHDEKHIHLRLSGVTATALDLFRPAPEVLELVEVVENHTTDMLLARMVTAFRGGEPVGFGNLVVAPEGIEQNGRRLVLTDTMLVTQPRLLVLRSADKLPVMAIRPVGLPNGHLVAPFLHQILRGGAA